MFFLSRQGLQGNWNKNFRWRWFNHWKCSVLQTKQCYCSPPPHPQSLILPLFMQRGLFSVCDFHLSYVTQWVGIYSCPWWFAHVQHHALESLSIKQWWRTVWKELIPLKAMGVDQVSTQCSILLLLLSLHHPFKSKRVWESNSQHVTVSMHLHRDAESPTYCKSCNREFRKLHFIKSYSTGLLKVSFKCSNVWY